jgi:hypothetical protein
MQQHSMDEEKERVRERRRLPAGSLEGTGGVSKPQSAATELRSRKAVRVAMAGLRAGGGGEGPEEGGLSGR